VDVAAPTLPIKSRRATPLYPAQHPLSALTKLNESDLTVHLLAMAYFLLLLILGA
jgi:hypothetical protein